METTQSSPTYSLTRSVDPKSSDVGHGLWGHRDPRRTLDVQSNGTSVDGPYDGMYFSRVPFSKVPWTRRVKTEIPGVLNRGLEVGSSGRGNVLLPFDSESKSS